MASLRINAKQANKTFNQTDNPPEFSECKPHYNENNHKNSITKTK
jgi:hypothetical protein